MTHKHLIGILLVSVIFLTLLAVPVFASDSYTYRAPISVTYSGATAYTALPIIHHNDNEYLRDNGFIQADALDTLVETAGGVTKPHMVTDNATLFVTDVPATSQVNLYYSMGNSDLVTMPIVLGYGGYFTIADNAALELGDNFSLNWTGYVDTSVSYNIVSKLDAIQLKTMTTGNITARINYDSVSQTTSNQDRELYSGATTRAGQLITNHTGRIGQVSVYLKKTGSPTGTAYIRIRDASTDTILATLGSIDVATLTGSDVWYQFKDSYTSVTSTDIRILLEYSGGSVGNSVTYHNSTSDLVSGIYCQYASSYIDGLTTFDMTYKYGGLVLDAPAIGGATIILSADGTNFDLTIDGATIDTVLLGSGSVPDNANVWSVGSSATPYMESFSITVGGVLKASYAPTSMIIGTALPNTTTPGSYTGTITWGTNPAGITTTMGGLVSGSQPSPGALASVPSPDLLPSNAGGSNWFRQPDETELHQNPFYMVIKYTSETGGLTDFTEAQVWRFFGIWFVIIMTAAAALIVRGHLLVASAICCAALWFMVSLTIFPMVVLVAIVPLLLVGLIMERSPSI